jgi:heat-inducible transcriptional repressor
MELNNRARKVLLALVKSYIGRPEPVGSRYLTKAHDFKLSSATIRNIMADLEEMGYLEQPHTSAGRVPTDIGFRFFVDSLAIKDRNSEADRLFNSISGKLRHLKDDVNAMLAEVTSQMADVTHCAVFAVPLRPENTTLNRVQLFRYKGSKTVAVLLTNEGLITNRVIDTDFGLSQKELDRVVDFLNSEYSGYTISEIRQSIRERVAEEKALRDILVTQCMKITGEALAFSGSDIIMAGVPELIGLPEFSTRINSIARAIEDKKRILSILERVSGSGEVSVLIGGENSESEFSDFSIVTAEYMQGDRPLGRVGMIGPTRMDYQRAIPMVGSMAKYISSVIIG